MPQQKARYWLLFELAGPLASYGGVAPGPMRDTELLPSRSAVLGLLAAAVGIERHEVQRQRELAQGLLVAARINAKPALLRDYHTAQAPTQPALKGRPCRTRRDEMRVPKDDLNTVLSDRYYYANYAATIGIAACEGERLEALAQALQSPHFTLYLGRKSCPPAWPLDPHQLEAPTWAEALAAHDERAKVRLAAFDAFAISERWLRSDPQGSAHRWDDGIEPGELATQPGWVQHRVTRRDEPLDTAQRLFAERSHSRAESRSLP